jgi:D-alanine-D-alanine ligase
MHTKPSRFTDPVLILYNEPQPGPHSESDAGVLCEVAAVAEALDELDVPHRVAGVTTLEDVGRALAAAPECCVVNLVESLASGVEDACHVPAVCRAFGKRVSGTLTPGLLLTLDKGMTKTVLGAAGVPVACAIAVPPGNECVLGIPDGPVIVKPLLADASEGIFSDSVLFNPAPASVAQCVSRIHADFGQTALVEQYLPGREFNVSLIEQDGRVDVLPLAEIDFSAFPPDKPRIVDYDAKWREDSFAYRHTPRRVPAEIDGGTAERIRETAIKAWAVTGCHDYARVDLRLDADGQPVVIEVNANPDISPDAGFAAALDAGGVAYARFVAGLLRNMGCRETPSSPPEAVAAPDVVIRRTDRSDRQAILDMLRETGVFYEHELDVALEVLDEALLHGETGHYQSHTAVRAGAVAGWSCFGPTPCTSGTYDLYWLCVHPSGQGRGVGTALCANVELLVAEQGGRRIVAETSGRDVYEPARRFYTAHGFRPAARVPDFYGPGDDKLIYVRSLLV